MPTQDTVCEAEVVPQKVHVVCPKCGWFYLSGEYIIMLRISGDESIAGQGKDESHRCPHCKEIINGGGDPSLCAVFQTLEEATVKACSLLLLMATDYEKFTRTVVLYDSSFLKIMYEQ